MEFTFDATEDGMKLMAMFTAQLVREGVTFEGRNRGDCYIVKLTGGY